MPFSGLTPRGNVDKAGLLGPLLALLHAAIDRKGELAHGGPSCCVVSVASLVHLPIKTT